MISIYSGQGVYSFPFLRSLVSELLLVRWRLYVSSVLRKTVGHSRKRDPTGYAIVIVSEFGHLEWSDLRARFFINVKSF
jgi:hypothetical protein